MENSSTPPPPPPPHVPPPPPPAPTPAQYYEGTAAPAPGEKKGCPKGLAIGCGAGGCLLLILLIAGTFFLFRDGGGGLISGLLGPLQSEVVNLAASDVTPEQKATFEREMQRLRDGLDSGDVALTRVQPVIDQLRGAVGDRSVTSEELDRLNELLLEVNDGASPPGTDAPATTSDGSVEL